MGVVEWLGSDRELTELTEAIGRNCGCTPAQQQRNAPGCCPAHQMLGNQRVMNHLLYVRRRRNDYQFEEVTR